MRRGPGHSAAIDLISSSNAGSERQRVKNIRQASPAIARPFPLEEGGPASLAQTREIRSAVMATFRTRGEGRENQSGARGQSMHQAGMNE